MRFGTTFLLQQFHTLNTRRDATVIGGCRKDLEAYCSVSSTALGTEWVIIKSDFSVARFLLFLFISSSWHCPLILSYSGNCRGPLTKTQDLDLSWDPNRGSEIQKADC